MRLAQTSSPLAARLGLPFLLAATLTPLAHSQASAAFEFDFRTSGLAGQKSHRLIAMNDGGVVSINLAVADNSATDGVLGIARYARDGDRVWSVATAVPVCVQTSCFGLTGVGADVDSGGNVIYSTGGRLTKLDPAGQTLWDVPLPPTALTLWAHVAVDGQDRPFVAGSTIGGDLFPYIRAASFEPDGSLRYTVDSSIRSELIGIEAGPGPQIALYGRSDFPGFGNVYGSTVLVDSNTGSVLPFGGPSSDGYTTGLGTVWSDTVEDVEYGDSGDLYAFTNGDYGSTFTGVDRVGFTIERITPNGQSLYRTNIESELRPRGRRIAVDGAGNAYVAGHEQFPGAATFDPVHWSVWKIDPSGNVVWQAQDAANSPTGSFATALEVMPDGRIFVTGRRWPEGIDFMLDPATGTVLWERVGTSDENGSVSYSWFSRDDVIAADGRQAWRLRQVGNRQRLARFVVGDAIGAPYCGPAVPNSTGQSGAIVALGSELAGESNLTLRLDGLPAGTFTMLINGQTPGLVPNVGGGQGTLCLGGTLGRFNRAGEIRLVAPDGSTSLFVDTAQIPSGAGAVPILSGQTWNFQGWFRDVDPGPTSNLTDAVGVTFQ